MGSAGPKTGASSASIDHDLRWGSVVHVAPGGGGGRGPGPGPAPPPAGPRHPWAPGGGGGVLGRTTRKAAVRCCAKSGFAFDEATIASRDGQTIKKP